MSRHSRNALAAVIDTSEKRVHSESTSQPDDDASPLHVVGNVHTHDIEDDDLDVDVIFDKVRAECHECVTALSGVPQTFCSPIPTLVYI